jgi:hypothetical protein
MNDSATSLLYACNSAYLDGADFPTIWEQTLKGHPLILGPPVQSHDDGGPVLEFRLLTGRRLVFGSKGFSIVG